MARRLLLLLLAAAALAGCGGAEHGGRATLWVTRDRGASVMLQTTVPAGQTLVRALEAKAEVKTRYGGRFVQAIDGVEGSLSAQRDWFWFVNGIEGDRSAAEYRLRPGDVAWWDYRSWAGRAQEQPVVVGSFPEPFLHGWNGHRRPVAVRYGPGRAADARRVARQVGGASVARVGTPVPGNANLIVLVPGARRASASPRTPGSGAGSPVVFRLSGPLDGLAGAVRHRYALP